MTSYWAQIKSEFREWINSHYKTSINPIVFTVSIHETLNRTKQLAVQPVRKRVVADGLGSGGLPG